MIYLGIAGAALGAIGLWHVISDFAAAWPRIKQLLRSEWK